MQKSFTASEAYTVVRFFWRLEHQISIALREHRYEDAQSMSRLHGVLQSRIFDRDTEERFFLTQSLFDDGRRELEVA